MSGPAPEITESFDPDRYRDQSLRQWEGAAPGWERRQRQMREFSAPVSEWLIEAAQLRSPHCVLDLASGIGETGCIAAARVMPQGTVILADQAQAMVAAARRRAQELELANVQCRELSAESLDLPAASLDAVICRWGLMLMADPDAALKECRRVLRSGGRIALAVWGAPQRNPWAGAPMGALIELQIISPPPRGDAREGSHLPGMFALADPNALRQRLLDAGFGEVRTEALELTRSHPDFEDFWETTLDLSSEVRSAVAGRPQAELERIRDAVRARLEPFIGADGSLAIPALALVACASA